MDPGGYLPINRRAYDVYVRTGGNLAGAQIEVLVDASGLSKALEKLNAAAENATTAFQELGKMLEIAMLEEAYNDNRVYDLTPTEACDPFNMAMKIKALIDELAEGFASLARVVQEAARRVTLWQPAFVWRK